MLKKVVVVYLAKGLDGSEYSDQTEFEAKKDYLDILNNSDGLLIIRDVDNKTSKFEVLGVFNKNAWQGWKAKDNKICSKCGSVKRLEKAMMKRR